jgi:beta-alanine--pyruvate transaminase
MGSVARGRERVSHVANWPAIRRWRSKTMTDQSMANHWLPFTPNRDFHAEPKLFARAQGAYYYTPDGREVLDASSGLFTTPAGHGRREIAEAVYKQLQELDYISSFQRSHPKAFEAAERIARLTPAGLDRVFFSSSGSEAVDTAMKIALAYHRARGQASRTIFVSRERAYHGVGFGGVALSGLVNNRRTFGPGLPQAIHMRHTHQKDALFTKGEADHGADLADDLDRLAALHGGENIAACFVEPIAGSTGTLVPPKGYLKRLREICDKHGVLLVFDEVITGFGRTGHAFAAQSFGVKPDMMTMAKAITNGAQPMSAVAVHNKIYQTIVEESPNPREANEFFHGYTWSAHPAACAAAIATMDIYENERLFERANQMSAYFLEGLFSLKDAPLVTDIRGYGMMGGIDLEPLKTPGARGHQLQKKLYDNGVHIKTTGDSGVIAPPFIVTTAEIDRFVETMRATLKAL